MGCARLNLLKVQQHHAEEAHEQTETKANQEQEKKRSGQVGETDGVNIQGDTAQGYG
jgi:hypothetical protein